MWPSEVAEQPDSCTGTGAGVCDAAADGGVPAAGPRLPILSLDVSSSQAPDAAEQTDVTDVNADGCQQPAESESGSTGEQLVAQALPRVDEHAGPGSNGSQRPAGIRNITIELVASHAGKAYGHTDAEAACSASLASSKIGGAVAAPSVCSTSGSCVSGSSADAEGECTWMHGGLHPRCTINMNPMCLTGAVSGSTRAFPSQGDSGGDSAPVLPEAPAGMRAPLLPRDAQAAQACAHARRCMPPQQPASDAGCSARGSAKLHSSALLELAGEACEQPAPLVHDPWLPQDVPSTPPNDPPERASRAASAPAQSEPKPSAYPVPRQPVAEHIGTTGAAPPGLEQGSGQGLPPLRTAASPLRRRLRCWRAPRRVRIRALDGPCRNAQPGGAAAAAWLGAPWVGRASLLDSLAPTDMAAPALVLEALASADMATPVLLGLSVAGRRVPCRVEAGARLSAHALPPPAAAAPSMQEAESTPGECVTTPGRTDAALAGEDDAVQQPGNHSAEADASETQVLCSALVGERVDELARCATQANAPQCRMS